MFTAFHGRDVRDARDFIYLAGERAKPCPGGDSLSMRKS